MNKEEWSSWSHDPIRIGSHDLALIRSHDQSSTRYIVHVNN